MNICNNKQNLPFKLDKDQFNDLEADLKKYDEIKEKYDKLVAIEEAPEMKEYDQILIELNNLIFSSSTLVKVRALYDNCMYILEMAQ
jgi:hypothetical protein